MTARSPISREAFWFIAITAVQGAANYGTYLAVLLFAPWWVAFLAAAAVGIALQTVLQITSTFRMRIRAQIGVPYVAYQLCFMAAFGSLLALVIRLGVLPALAPFAVLVVITPANFVISRWIIQRPAAS
jgi:putative flippase GtrA